MKKIFYNLALLAGLGAAAPWLAARLCQGRYRNIALARLGLGSAWLPQPMPEGGIWVHALSVGEVGSALPLLKALGERFPARPLILSAATAQGLAVARQNLSNSPVRLLVRPLDVPWAVGRLMDRIKPGLFCQVEGDIWPGWLWALSRRGVPRLLVNGRVSPRTFKGYRRLAPLARELFRGFDRVLVQTEVDHDRLIRVGVDPRKLAVGGNLKFDSAPACLGAKARQTLAAEMGLKGRQVLVAGSTHPGEEDFCLAAFVSLKEQYTGLVLLIAPREVGRGIALVQMAERLGLRTALLSRGTPPAGTQVVIVDILGRLAQAYALGEAAFVGGSLVPVGGHNLLEPAAQGVPVLYGPHTHNFLTMAHSLEELGGGLRLKRGEDLSRFWGRLLADEGFARKTGQAAQAFCRAHQGAVDRTVAEAAALLES